MILMIMQNDLKIIYKITVVKRLQFIINLKKLN